MRLLIYPNGTKIWLFNYIKLYLNKRTEISLGAFPELFLTRGYSISRYYITAWVGCSEPFRISKNLFGLRKWYLVLKVIAEYAKRFEYWTQNKWKYLSVDLPMPDRNKHHVTILL